MRVFKEISLIALLIGVCSQTFANANKVVSYDYTVLEANEIGYFEWSGLPVLVFNHGKTIEHDNFLKLTDEMLKSVEQSFSKEFVNSLKNSEVTIGMLSNRSRLKGVFVALAIDIDSGCKIILHNGRLLDPCTFEEYSEIGIGKNKLLLIPDYRVEGNKIYLSELQRSITGKY